MKKLTKKEMVLLGVSAVGLGVAGYLGIKHLNRNKACPLCSEGTQCISDVTLGNHAASVRLDLDFNQIDCELIKMDPETGAVFGEWSTNPLIIKHCPECGKKLK